MREDKKDLLILALVEALKKISLETHLPDYHNPPEPTETAKIAIEALTSPELEEWKNKQGNK